MKIIISPAKKMRDGRDFYDYKSEPIFLDKAKNLYENYIKHLSYDELKKIFNCSDSIAKFNYERYLNFDFEKNKGTALFSYDGIQYSSMGVNILSYDELDYLENKLFIISGLYGLIKCMDGIVNYRLELGLPFKTKDFNSLYEYWGKDIYDELYKDEDIVVNLGSNEYSRIVSKYLTKDKKFITIYFYEDDAKLVEKGVYVKIARGNMVKYMASNKIENVEEIKKFNMLGYEYNDILSDSSNYIFIRRKENVKSK